MCKTFNLLVLVHIVLFRQDGALYKYVSLFRNELRKIEGMSSSAAQSVEKMKDNETKSTEFE